ncbi:MAG: DUF4239 domain-containing protein [Candidatus Eremiobacteraeota bacterium]|nr:DUF4239 domain-containing protein [Candidatus Eremiobacteraeota bacterium]
MIDALQEIHPHATRRALAGAYALTSSVTATVLLRIAPSTFVHANAILLLLWATTTAVATACAGQAYVHSRFRAFDFVQHNEVGGFIVAVVGALYGVLLGFMTVIAWQHYAEARQVVAQESAAATDAWHTSVGMPASPRSRVRRDMLLYAEAMKEREWLAMRSGTYDKDADLIVMDAISAAGNFVPANLKESNAQSNTLQQLGALHDYRWRRLSDNESGISPFEWLVLLLGAACIVGFCWLFGLENRDVHLMMTSAVTIVVTATLVLLFELQYPFQSDLRIASGDWSGAVAHIQAMQSGSQSEMRM